MNLLFTSPNCPKCPIEKEALKQKGVDFKEIDISTDDGLFMALSYNVMSTPRLVKSI